MASTSAAAVADDHAASIRAADIASPFIQHMVRVD